MTEENYINPFESHAVSTDKALMLMLGIRGELRHYVDGEIIDIELKDILFDIHEKADIELSNVKFDQNEYEDKGGQDPDQLNNFSKDRDIKEKALQQASDLIARYNDFNSKIRHEIAKAQSGKESKLVIDSDITGRFGLVHITKISLYEWCKEQCGIDLLDPDTRITNIQPKGLSGTKEKNTSITTYLLAQALAELIDLAREKQILKADFDKNNKSIQLVKNEKLNISALVRFLKPYTKKIPGQKERIINKRLTESINTTARGNLEAISDEEIEESIKTGEYNLDVHI